VIGVYGSGGRGNGGHWEVYLSVWIPRMVAIWMDVWMVNTSVLACPYRHRNTLNTRIRATQTLEVRCTHVKCRNKYTVNGKDNKRWGIALSVRATDA
jgi:hypothetical protein